jgi:hypothetical protein
MAATRPRILAVEHHRQIAPPITAREWPECLPSNTQESRTKNKPNKTTDKPQVKT